MSDERRKPIGRISPPRTQPPSQPYFVWKSSFNLGIPQVDEEHRHFFDIINDLHAALETGEERAIVDQTMAELREYARFHFAHEEDFLQLVGYPDLAQHRAQHRHFVLALQRIQGQPAAKAVAALCLARDWLLEHILGMDQRYTKWVASTRATASQTAEP